MLINIRRLLWLTTDSVLTFTKAGRVTEQDDKYNEVSPSLENYIICSFIIFALHSSEAGCQVAHKVLTDKVPGGSQSARWLTKCWQIRLKAVARLTAHNRCGQWNVIRLTPLAVNCERTAVSHHSNNHTRGCLTTVYVPGIMKAAWSGRVKTAWASNMWWSQGSPFCWQTTHQDMSEKSCNCQMLPASEW